MSARILIVDDEPTLCRALERALKNFKYDVVSVADPNSAYEILGESTFDLVLLDLRLPHMAGDTLYLAIVRRWPRLQGRVILMSGDTWPPQLDWPAELVACPVLLKPFTLDSMVKLVGVVLAAAGSVPDLLEGNGHG